MKFLGIWGTASIDLLNWFTYLPDATVVTSIQFQQALA
jgi:hypothetical protein